VGLDRGPLGLMSTIEELLERISNDSGLENQYYGHADYATPLFSPKVVSDFADKRLLLSIVCSVA
jgi:hypothetical protein